MENTKLKFISKFILLFSLFVLISEAFAKSYSWNNLTRAEYISNRINCEKDLQKLKWSNYLWPETNSNSKPHFDSVVNSEKIKRIVLENMKMEKLLASRFNTKITYEMFQHELDRMVLNTNDIEGLKELFNLFDYDSKTITQCISRPNLVRQKIRDNYYNSNIHSNIKETAQSDLDSYLKDGKINNLKSITETFLLQNKNDHLTNNNDQQMIELSLDEFRDKIDDLEYPQLKENNHGFYYQEIIEREIDSIRTLTLYWLKKPFQQWIESHKEVYYFPDNFDTDFVLQNIDGQKNNTGLNKNNFEGVWDSRYYISGPKYFHTAVWTGQEMIIWGGSHHSPLNTGAIYNPSTDSWRETSTGINVAEKRRNHKAIWTGVEMIVWGGQNSSGNLNSGGRYNPVTNEWKLINTEENSPGARFGNSVTWTGIEMIVWGGYKDEEYTNTGARYNPQSDTWQLVNVDEHTATARLSHTSVWTGSNMIVWGGRIESGQTTSSGASYEPVSDSWFPIEEISDVPSNRASHIAHWTGEEMIIWGGNASGITNTGGLYNPKTNSWRPISILEEAPSPREDFSSIWTGKEMIIWGGTDGENSLSTGGRYDPSSNSWTATNSRDDLLVEKRRHTAIWTGEEMIVWGGGNEDINPTFTGARYNPGADSWRLTSTGGFVPSPRTGHTANWIGTEMIILGGGIIDTDFGGRYDPVLDHWLPIQIEPVDLTRGFHTTVWTGTELILWGGSNNGQLNTGVRYNPLTNVFEQIRTDANTPSPRYDHKSIWTGEEMIVWGGWNLTTGLMNNGGLYNPSTDSWLPTAIDENTPSIRNSFTSVWTGEEMIIWGGYSNQSGTELNSGSKYNPTTNSWSPMNEGINNPEERRVHTAVWTGTEMIIWGGFNGFGSLITGGIYNPQTDSWLSTSTGPNVPSNRSSHTAIWTGEEMIIWAGSRSNQQLNSGGRFDPITDTWIPTGFNGSVPRERIRHTAIWADNSMLIWGGVNPSFTNSLGIYYPNVKPDRIFLSGFE